MTETTKALETYKAQVNKGLEDTTENWQLWRRAFQKGKLYAEQQINIHVVGVCDKILMECSDCNLVHFKVERIEKTGSDWTTYHCPKCNSESTYVIKH